MEEEKISCIGCKRLFQHSGILRHLSSESAKDCKAFYTDEALESLKRASRKRRNQLDTERKFKKRQKLLSSKNEEKVTSTDYKVSCKVCKRKFFESEVLKHIYDTENCKLNYPKNDLSNLKTSIKSRNKMNNRAKKCRVHDPDSRSKNAKVDTLKMNVNESITCKGCNKSFKRLTILKHLSHAKKCKQSFSEETRDLTTQEENNMSSKSLVPSRSSTLRLFSPVPIFFSSHFQPYHHLIH